MGAYVPSVENATTANIVHSLTGLASGRTNAVGDVTLRAGQTTTVVFDDSFTQGSAVILTPTSAHAAAALATTWLDLSTNGSFLINHASSAFTDLTFRYAIQG